MRDWWRSYFGDDFFQLHVDLFPEAASRSEVSAMLDLLGLHQGSRILDVPCGWGRHSQLLAQAGFDVHGTDLSPQLLARTRNPDAPPRDTAPPDAADTPPPDAPVRYTAADIRQLPYAEASFDAAINVFTSLGLFLEDGEDIKALQEIRRVLRPNGRFLLESMHRDDVIRSYAVRDGWTLPNGIEVRVRRRFDPITGISHERLRWRRGTERGQKRHALRLRTATEIDALLRAAGFVAIEYFGDWQGRRLDHASEHVIAVASPA